MAHIVSIVHQPATDRREKPSDRFVRISLDQATLLDGHGME